MRSEVIDATVDEVGSSVASDREPPSPAEIADALRAGRRVTDRLFDSLYPEHVRAVSGDYWTPVRVAMRAAALLVEGRGTRVLDVGSGVGKFCMIGAATTKGSFTGIEHREHLVDAAREAGAGLGVERVTLAHGTLASVRWDDFDAFFLYNPFQENVYCRAAQLDESVELSQERMVRDVATVEEALASARAGTRVVTYFGFGGKLPTDYHLAKTVRCVSGRLRLWVKAPGRS